METIQGKLYELSTKYFHKWYGLLSTLILIWIVTLTIYKLIPTNTWFYWYALGIVSICLIVGIGWGVYTFRYPRRSKKRLGLVIAVQIESLEDFTLFKKDFLLPFKEKIAQNNLPFDILVLKNHQSENVETMEDAKKILKKTRGHFILWGEVKRRNHQNKEHYVFALRAMVIHSPITEIQKVFLTQDFDALLRNQVMFETGLQYMQFNLRSDELFSAVNFITGRAALLSGDVSMAITLHENLYNQLLTGLPSSINLNNFKKLLSLEYAIKSDIVYFQNGQKTSFEFIQNVANSIKYDPKNYGALLKKAIVDFADGDGDATKAMSTLQGVHKNQRTKEWLYSKTFLHLWLKQYDKALYEVKKIEKKDRNGEEILARQICVFNENILSKFPQNVEVAFWSGFLNYKKIKNLSLADTLFQRVIDHATPAEQRILTISKTYLQEIQAEIGYS